MRIEEIAIGSTFLLVQSVGEGKWSWSGSTGCESTCRRGLPSRRRAQRQTFHPIDQPVLGSPRCMSGSTGSILKEFRCLLRCNLITWIEGVEMTHMAMIIWGSSQSLIPFLQLSHFANLHRCHLSQHFLQMSCISGIFCPGFSLALMTQRRVRGSTSIVVP